jgi:hypothetical protein
MAAGIQAHHFGPGRTLESPGAAVAPAHLGDGGTAHDSRREMR